MKRWWRSRTLKLRLTLWYAVVSGVILAGLAVFVYGIVEHRLRLGIDRQLRGDFERVITQLQEDDDWRQEAKDEGDDQALGWVEIWSARHRLLLSRWPHRQAGIKSPLGPPSGRSIHFQTIELKPDRFVRVLEGPDRLSQRPVIVRVFRDEAEMRGALRQIGQAFLLALPLTVLMCSLGGYLIAGYSLKPLAAMVAQARRITSESLGQRLPNANRQDELGQLANVFNKTLQRLENSFAELKRFTADASHEMRTPLTALRSVGEVALRQNGSPENHREAIESMLEEAEKLTDLIESLLTLARLDSGAARIRLESLRVTEIAQEVRARLSVLATEKQQTIALEGDDGLLVITDRLALRQALTNIVDNALRYAPPKTRVNIRIFPQDDQGVIEVSDQGPGIASEHLPKLFDRFYRVDKARSRSAGGHGLGLSIAKWALERQGGRLEVQSQAGERSTFRILVPLKGPAWRDP